MFKKIRSFVTIIAMAASMAACSNVENGHVGVKIDRYGSDRGVSTEVLKPGRYFTGMNTDVYQYPTFTQTDKWTKSADEGKAKDESISFAVQGGVTMNSDVSISYHVDEANVVKIFQKYRQNIEVISDGPLRNIVRDELNRVGSDYSVEDLQGNGKSKLMSEVKKDIMTRAAAIGVTVEDVTFINEFRYPGNIQAAINAKIQATQNAMQIENQVRGVKAEQEKAIAVAEGQVKVAKAEAEAMELRGKAMQQNGAMLEYKRLEVQQAAIEKWDGALPAQMIPGSAVPFLNLNK